MQFSIAPSLQGPRENRVDELQGMFRSLQSARKESCSINVALLEEQVHQMLGEWKGKLGELSPATSLQQGGILGSFSSQICRLQLCTEQDDATSALAAPKAEPDVSKAANGSNSLEGFSISTDPQGQGFSSGLAPSEGYLGSPPVNLEELA